MDNTPTIIFRGIKETIITYLALIRSYNKNDAIEPTTQPKPREMNTVPQSDDTYPVFSAKELNVDASVTMVMPRMA